MFDLLQETQNPSLDATMTKLSQNITSAFQPRPQVSSTRMIFVWKSLGDEVECFLYSAIHKE